MLGIQEEIGYMMWIMSVKSCAWETEMTRPLRWTEGDKGKGKVEKPEVEV